MNKQELIDAIADRTNQTKKTVKETLEATLDVIMETVAQRENVTLVGFGTFECRDRQEREGHNPKTNEKIIIPATQVPAFSAGKPFKNLVKGG